MNGENNNPNFNLRALATVAMHVLAAIACGTLFLYVAPQFLKLYTEFEIDLPAYSQGIFSLSKFFVKYWYAIAILWLFYLIASIFFVYKADSKKSAKMRLAMTVLPLAILFIVGFIMMIVPYASAADGLAQ